MMSTTPAATLQSATPVLLVSDIATTMRWYHDVLGFEGRAVPDAPPYTFAILQRDEVVIFLQQLDGYRKPDLYAEREGGVWTAYIRTAGVRALYDAIKESADVTLLHPLHRQPYGQTEFELRDPNGYVLVFAEGN